MKPDELREFLTLSAVSFEEKEVPYGRKFKCEGGEVFVAYDTGKVVCQGKSTDLSLAVKSWKKPAKAVGAGVQPKEKPSAVAPAAMVEDKPVFIVYGHDTAAREGLELVLHKMGLKPIVLENLPADGDTVIEKLERYLGEHGDVGFACVLLTPDDEGHEAGKAGQKKYRARQNVILELGMVLARLGRRRVLILIKESVEQPSDIAGLIYRRFKERVDELKGTLFKDLQEAGYKPDSKGL
jgi:predicted nucleotide-binding protein